jgi:hypothetical protein
LESFLPWGKPKKLLAVAFTEVLTYARFDVWCGKAFAHTLFFFRLSLRLLVPLAWETISMHGIECNCFFQSSFTKSEKNALFSLISTATSF